MTPILPPLEPDAGPRLLERTFRHVPQVGERTEQRLWRAGAFSWQTFLADPFRYRPAGRSTAAAVDVLRRSCKALEQGNHAYFAKSLPSPEQWRALSAFPDGVAFLDIETDGRGDNCVTVVGLLDRTGLRQFVRGQNLLEFESALDETAMLVTYFGGGFDLPVLRRQFPRMRFDQLHTDLCPLLRRLGLTGGLKRIESVLGLTRGEETAGLNGWDAVLLWREWQRGSEEAGRRLLAYNADDVLHLVPLARFAFARLRERLLDPGRVG